MQKMNVEFLRRFCLSFPHATEKLQWGDDLCFKVGGKIFAAMWLGSVPPRLIFKCNPERFAELVEQEGISPAPYVGRYKWVSLERLNVLPWSELKDLLEQSYGMVATKAKVGKPVRAKPRNSARANKRKRNTKGKEIP